MPVAETQAPVLFDKRVDQIGFADRLNKLHVADLRTEVKSSLIEKGMDLVAGDAFVGVLVSSNEKTIDPKKFHGLIKKGVITEKQFFASIRVVNTDAARVLGKDAAAEVSTVTPASPRLVVSPKEGVEVSLVEALKGLAAAADNSK